MLPLHDLASISHFFIYKCSTLDGKKLPGNGIHDRKIQFDDQASEFMSTKAHIIVFTYTKFSPCRTIIIQRIQWQLAFSATTMESRERLNWRELSSTIKDSCNVHFFGHWCHQCRYALPKLNDFYKLKKKKYLLSTRFYLLRTIYVWGSENIPIQFIKNCVQNGITLSKKMNRNGT